MGLFVGEFASVRCPPFATSTTAMMGVFGSFWEFIHYLPNVSYHLPMCYNYIESLILYTLTVSLV